MLVEVVVVDGVEVLVDVEVVGGIVVEVDVDVDVEVLVDVEDVEVEVDVLVEVEVDVDDVVLVTLDGCTQGVVSVAKNVRWWQAARISPPWSEKAWMTQVDVTQLTTWPVPIAVKVVCTVKLTGMLLGSCGVCGLPAGPKAPLRPVVKGVLLSLQRLRSSVHCRRTPVWLAPKRRPSTATTWPSVRLSLGETWICGSKACGSGSPGSVGSNVVANAVPARATSAVTNTATNALLPAFDFVMSPAFNGRQLGSARDDPEIADAHHIALL